MQELTILAILAVGRLAEQPLIRRNVDHQLTGVVIVPEVLHCDTAVQGVKGGDAHDGLKLKERDNVIVFC
jgi:hypothetical protein